MTLVVKKFGGTSLANLEGLQHVASLVSQAVSRGEQVVVVVSAMAGTTNQLVAWVDDIAGNLSYGVERDVVISSGEQVTAGLLALSLQSLGVPARSWMGWQLPILTTHCSGQADIVSMDLCALTQDLVNGIVPVVAGFQGIAPQGFLTTLGRGGSDTTAVVIATTLKADWCQIFTDVRGVYTADPRIVKDARPYESISYEDMLMLSEYGAKVLHSKAIEWAQRHSIPIQVLSTMEHEDPGTWIRQKAHSIRGIAQKNILIWDIAEITPQQAQSIYCDFQQQEISLFDWQVSPKGLQFLAWPEDQRRIQRVLPLAFLPKEMVLITLVGSTFLDTRMLSNQNVPIARTFRFPYAIGIVIDDRYAKKALTTLHHNLGLHEVS